MESEFSNQANTGNCSKTLRTRLFLLMSLKFKVKVNELKFKATVSSHLQKMDKYANWYSIHIRRDKDVIYM